MLILTWNVFDVMRKTWHFVLIQNVYPVKMMIFNQINQIVNVHSKERNDVVAWWWKVLKDSEWHQFTRRMSTTNNGISVWCSCINENKTLRRSVGRSVGFNWKLFIINSNKYVTKRVNRDLSMFRCNENLYHHTVPGRCCRCHRHHLTLCVRA